MKADKVLCRLFLFTFLALTAHKTRLLFNNHAQCLSAKQKIVHDRRLSNLNLVIFV